MALLLLELLVIYPWAMETNVLVEFLPYSFGGLLVLGMSVPLLCCTRLTLPQRPSACQSEH